MARPAVPVDAGLIRHPHAPVLECLPSCAQRLAGLRGSLAHLVTATIPPIAEELFEVPVAATMLNSRSITATLNGTARTYYRPADGPARIDLAAPLPLLPRFRCWKHDVLPHQSRSAKDEFAGVDDFAPVFVTPVAARHFRLALLLRLLHMTAHAKPVHRLGIGDGSVMLNGDRSARPGRGPCGICRSGPRFPQCAPDPAWHW